MNWYYDYGEPEKDDYTLGNYETPSEAIVLAGPVRAVSKRGVIGKEWWGQQWVAAMERLGGNRLGRGKRYARNGSVARLEISHGMTYAEVQGSYGYAYRTAVELKIFDDKEWQRVLIALSEQAIYAAKLLSGEMPADIEAVFQSVGLSLFPRSLSDIQFECSCPDWGDPCKHAAAVYYLLAEQLDADPFMLFHLRGRTREQVLAFLRSQRSTALNGVAVHPEEIVQILPLDADLSTFWNGLTQHLIRPVHFQPEAYPVLQQLGKPPGDLKPIFEEIYSGIATEAHRWLGLDEEQRC